VGLLVLYVCFYRRFVLGREFAFHDTMWDHHAFYAVIKQWLDAGLTVGWNPFMNGGEPLYLYSNLFLWAELIGFVAMNWLLGIPTHELINLYFTFILLSFATLCFVLFSVLFRERVVAFYAVIPVLFGGLTASTLAQYMLSPLYLLPVALLAAYLLVRDRDPAWLLALMFIVCVSANHYLPHYLVLSVAGYLAGVGIVAGVRRLRNDHLRDGDERGPRARLGPVTVLAALVLSTAALAPAVFVHREARDLVSPTRGNVAVADGGIGVQPGVHQSLDRYRYLVRLPRMQPGDPSWENLEYAHGVFYIGWIPVLLAVASLGAYGRAEYWGVLLAFALVAALALGDSFVAWRLLKAYLPFFYLRHAYPLSLSLTLFILILSGFGLQRLVPSKFPQILICGLTLAMCLQATSRVHGATRRSQPFVLSPLVYPAARTAYADIVSEVPVDSSSLITKRAAATHVNDDFILFRTRPYQELLQRDLPFVVGPVFAWSRQLEWTPPDLTSAPNEIENGSFERWVPGGGPAGFERRIDSPRARIEENRDRAWVYDGQVSARMVVAAGAVAKLAFVHPRAPAIRGRFLEVSACLASPGGRPVGAALTVLQAGGYNILTPHTYRGGGGWDCFQRTVLVGESAASLEVILALSSPVGATAYVDRLELRAFPEARQTGSTPALARELESRDPSRLVVRVEAPEDGYLVRKENYHRGWSASVDGRPATIERYAGAFQAIALARGPHTVEFTFSSVYPLLMWIHVAAVLSGYLALYGYLVRTVASSTGSPAAAAVAGPA
jgi:hypothetical protein